MVRSCTEIVSESKAWRPWHCWPFVHQHSLKVTYLRWPSLSLPLSVSVLFVWCMCSAYGRHNRGPQNVWHAVHTSRAVAWQQSASWAENRGAFGASVVDLVGVCSFCLRVTAAFGSSWLAWSRRCRIELEWEYRLNT